MNGSVANTKMPKGTNKKGFISESPKNRREKGKVKNTKTGKCSLDIQGLCRHGLQRESSEEYLQITSYVDYEKYSLDHKP